MPDWPLCSPAQAVWLLAAAGLAAAYYFIVFRYVQGFRQTPAWQLPPGYTPRTRVSVVIAARNEAVNIEECLGSVLRQNFPVGLFEVLVVDDHSEDETFAIAQAIANRHPNVVAIRLADYWPNLAGGAFKKRAIETGIAAATGDLIVTTDADCSVQQDWLLLIAAMFEIQQPQFIAAPVNFIGETNLLERFQSLDFLGMMGMTAASIRLKLGRSCNGANLAYPKAVFVEVGGFSGVDGLASGDDILLLHKIASRYPDGVFFLKNRAATVFTKPKPDLPSFLSQRLRWATKSAKYQEWQVTAILALVFFLCWGIVLGIASAVYLGWPAAAGAALLLIVKGFADYRFLGEMSRYFGRKDLMRYFLPSLALHIAYIVAIGTLANFKKNYRWKGRRAR